MQFIDEQNDLTFLFGQIIEHRFETLLEFTAEFRPGDQRTHVQGQQAFAFEALRHFAVDDALRQTFDDGGLAHARFADQHRIVLGAPLQNLNGATDFVIATDDRIELALFGALGQIDGVFLQGLALFLGIRIVHLLTAAQLFDGFLDQALGGAGLTQRLAHRTLVFQRGEHEQLRRDVLILALLGKLVGLIEHAIEVVGDMYVAAAALHRRQFLHGLAQLRTQQVHIDVGLREQMPHTAALLVEQRDQHMHRLDELMIAAHGEALGIGEGGLKFTGQFVHAHGAKLRSRYRWDCLTDGGLAGRFQGVSTKRLSHRPSSNPDKSLHRHSGEGQNPWNSKP